jgi:hypothetical protein
MRYVFLLFATSLLAADDLPVKLDGGNLIQLCADCSPRQIRAAVTATKFSVSKGETPRVVEVNLNGVREKAWTDWFQVSWDPPVGAPAALAITVSDKLQNAGTYNLVLSLRPNLPKLALQVVQPAAQLDVPDKLLINRTQDWPWSCCEPASFSVDLRESSGLAGITGLEFFNRQATQGAEGVEGKIELKSPRAIPAGHAASIEFELEGDYPRGTSTGALKLIAPQLAQPVALPYEVHTKLHPLYLLLAIGIGLALSYLVRYQLQNRLLLSQARVQADQILQDVGDHLENYDATTRTAVEGRRTELREAAVGVDVKAITDGATALRDAWKAAVEQYDTRTTQATTQLRDLQLVVGIDWNEPLPVQAACQAAKTATETAKDRLQHRKPDEALAALAAAGPQLANALRNLGLAWQNDSRGLSESIAQATLGIPEPVRAQFALAWQQSPPELNRTKADAIAADSASLRGALDDLQVEYLAFGDFLGRLKQRMRLEWAAVENLWHPVTTLPHRELLEQLGLDFSALADDLGAAASNPALLAAALPDRLGRLQEKWSEAIVRQLPPGHAALTAIRTAIQARTFVEAVRAMVAAIPAEDGLWGSAPAAPSAAWPAALAHEATAAHLTTIFNYSSPTPSAIPGLPRMRLLRDVRRIQLLQTAVVGALTALWAFTSYSQSFDGTYTGLLAPLVAAFLIDVSVEGLKNQVKEKTA